MNKSSAVVLDDHTRALVIDYAEIMGMEFEEALAALIRHGVDEVKKNANSTLKGMMSSGNRH